MLWWIDLNPEINSSEIIKTISSTPSTLNSLSSLLNTEREESVLPPLPLFDKQSVTRNQVGSPTSNNHSVLLLNNLIPLNIKTSHIFQLSESQYANEKFSKFANSSFGKILAPKATYSAPTGLNKSSGWLEVSSEDGSTSQDFVNKSSMVGRKSKIDYISLLNKMKQHKNLSTLDKFLEARTLRDRSAFKPRPIPRILGKKEIKRYDAPLRQKNQELSSAESDSMLGCPSTTIQ